MYDEIKGDLHAKIMDTKLVDSLFESYQRICEEYVAQKPVDLLQNTGLFVESSLRIIEHLVLARHTPLGKQFKVDDCIDKLERASGSEGLRIHAARLSRAVYDFRTRKKSVHLKDVDPQAIDAHLVYETTTWILIEILKESGVANPEGVIRSLFTRKIALVQSVDGVLRTTNPKLSGTHRILLLLYSAPDGLDENQLFAGTRYKISSKSHLRTNLKNLEARDLIHIRASGRWTLFGRGINEAENLVNCNS